MKKELLIASALVSTLGVASVAQAGKVDATMAGSMKIGVEFESADDASTDTNNVKDQSNFNISLSQMNDNGTTFSTSFEIVDEGTVAADDDNALKLTFQSGHAVELLNAGSAAGTHAVSVPSAGGEQGVGGTSTNNAPTGVSFSAPSTVLGVEWHSPADFLTDGFKMSASISTDDGSAKGATPRTENAWGVGATYVTTAGDTTLTIGGGYGAGETAKTGTQAPDPENFNLGVSAVTGDLTIGVAFGDGDQVNDEGGSSYEQVDGSVVTAGISYAASDDITLALGATAGEAKDSTTIGTAGTTDDSVDSVSASVTYTVADGVSAVLGYTTVDRNNEGSSSTDGGSAWYIGASMSF